jgi:hypothetical protein
MNLRIFLAAIAALFVCTLATTPAHAQATRTWVSGVGDDVNPCSRTAPCKTFAGAISKTAAGGEINCLDPAGFGAVTTTKSITIDCTGTLGGILASSTFGVTINGAGAIVTLRGLEINGGPPNLPGTFGVRFLLGTRLNIEDCTIYNFAAANPNGHGVLINNTTGQARVFITNTVIRNNGSATFGSGIRIIPTGAAGALVVLNNVHLTGNFRGIDMVTTGTSAGSNVTINNSTIDHSVDNAINVVTNANTATLMLSNVTIANNLNGVITSGSGSVTRIGGSMITQNGSAISGAAGSTFFSYKNNQINGNAADNTPITDAVLQ